MSTWSDYLVAEIGSLKKTAQSAELGHAPNAQGDGAREITSGFLIKGTCGRCWAAFWKDICVVTDSEEEYEALKQTIREGRRRENPMPNGHELLKEIRARKPPTEH